MKSNFTVCLLGVAMALTLVVGHSAEQPIGARRIMRLKLNHSQKLLEALVQENYEAVAKQAHQLGMLSLDASWQVLQTPEYIQQSLQFRRAADALTTAAKEENYEGSTLAYIDLTMRCVDCHKYVRDAQVPEVQSPRVLRKNAVEKTGA